MSLCWWGSEIPVAMKRVIIFNLRLGTLLNPLVRIECQYMDTGASVKAIMDSVAQILSWAAPSTLPGHHPE